MSISGLDRGGVRWDVLGDRQTSSFRWARFTEDGMQVDELEGRLMG